LFPGAVKQYKGAAMTMDFVNADVTNILRLIAEVSNLNIVWGPEVRGTVSMRLKEVPWDQALDLVLDNNNLAMRKQGNVIWVTTKAQMAQIEAEERRRIQEYEARLEAERKKIIEEKEKEKELEPLVTEYIPVDFAKASDILPLLSVSETGKTRGGKLSVDARTNMIIMTDIGSNVKDAKETVKIFDTPVKQVMIEARIVDATDDFARDLGLRWDNIQVQRRNDTGVPFTAFTAPPTPGSSGRFPPGGRLTSPGVQLRLALRMGTQPGARLLQAERLRAHSDRSGRKARPVRGGGKNQDHIRPQGDCHERPGRHHQQGGFHHYPGYGERRIGDPRCHAVPGSDAYGEL
jgi:type II secretory pathway component GspD/PulD (secretin)